MSQYCDSTILERNWFDWLVSTVTPDLELYREIGILWTRVNGRVLDEMGDLITKAGRTFTDPRHVDRVHCLALGTPLFFTDLTKARIGSETSNKSLVFDKINPELNLLSDSPLHRLDDPTRISRIVIPSLQESGFEKERPTTETWHAILEDVSNICKGIATKFNPPSEEELMELAHEALLQVTNKLAKFKLVYTPGRAPVFNLLTTTIFRCMYSIQNRKKNQRNGMNRLIDDMQAGALPDNVRSFRAGMLPKGCLIKSS